ncbi:MAG: hypothetical protein JRJ16_09540 [Deltaproteobacteria bacterium]|nr:hypothetical protein [Deltaproteobacteria bacterium]
MKKLFVLGVAALLIVAFTVPAMAKVKGGVAKGSTTNEDDWSATEIQVPKITRFKARWTNEHNVGMYIEFGLGDDTYGDSGNADASLRHAYGWWDASPSFRIMAGHSTTPFSPLTPTQIVGEFSEGGLHIIGAGYGEFYSGRFPQLRFVFKFGDMGKLGIALVDPQKGTDAAPAAETGTTADNDSTIPRIDVGLDLYLGPVKLYPSFFYHKKTWDNAAAGQEDELTAYGYSLGIKTGFGPVTIAAEGQIGQNWGNTAGISNVVTPVVLASRAWNDQANGKMYDADCWAYWLDVGFKAGPATLHVLWGQSNAENERASGKGDDYEATSTMYGVSAIIPLSKTFLLRPEIMFYDWDDGAKVAGTEIDYGKQAIYGVCFMIAF